MKAKGEISSVNNQILSNTLRWLRHRRLNHATNFPTNRHDLSIYQNQIFTSSITLVDPIMGPEKKTTSRNNSASIFGKTFRRKWVMISSLWWNLKAGTRLRKAVKCFWKSFFFLLSLSLSLIHVSFFISLASFTNGTRFQLVNKI